MLGSNYFFGKDISDYYKKRIGEHPEQKKELKLEKNFFLLYGKILPNLTTIAGVGTAFLGEAYLTGAIIAGMSEAVRASVRGEFRFRIIDNLTEESCNQFNKLTTPEALEMIRKSLEKKL